MKAYFEFNLPEDQDEWRIYDNAMNYYLFINSMNEWLRAEIKYNSNRSEKELEILHEVREMYYEKLNDNDIKL